MDIKLKALADFASVTREGKINILGIFDQINPQALPFVLPQKYVVLVWEASAAEEGNQRMVRVILLDADARQVLSLEQQIVIPQRPHPGFRIEMNQIIGLAGLRLSRAGDFQVSILADNDEKGYVTFHVNDPPS